VVTAVRRPWFERAHPLEPEAEHNVPNAHAYRPDTTDRWASPFTIAWHHDAHGADRGCVHRFGPAAENLLADLSRDL
jgi:hypothetical protein